MTISLAAFVAPSERATVKAACSHMLRALESAGGVWKADCQFTETVGDLATAAPDAILLLSLLPEVDIHEPWATTEARLFSLYAGLSERGTPVFIFTVLRHAGDGDRDVVHARRVRIRRLNALAAELSRQFGAFVVDIDRVLADVGARRLRTDYRLNGASAADLAGKAMATDIVVNGLDAFIDFDLQDAAKTYLAQYQTIVPLPNEIKPQNLMVLGRGRRKQVVATITDNDQKGHVRWLIQQVMNGSIGPKEAFAKFGQAVRRRGAKESFTMLANIVLKIGRRA